MRFAAPALILLTAAFAIAAETQPASKKTADAPELIAGLSKMPKELWPAADETAEHKKSRGTWVMKFLLQQSGKKLHFSGQLAACDVVRTVLPPLPGMRPPRGAVPPPGYVPPKLPTKAAVNLSITCGDVDLWGKTYHIKANFVPADVTPEKAADAQWAVGDTVKIDGPIGAISLQSAEPDTITVTIRDTARFTVTPEAASPPVPAPATRP